MLMQALKSGQESKAADPAEVVAARRRDVGKKLKLADY